VSYSDPSLELQKAIVAVLKADASVNAIIAGRIYDAVPGGAKKPYVSFGPFQLLPEHGDCLDGGEAIVTLDGWAAGPDTVQVKKLGTAIAKALDMAPIVLEQPQRCVEMSIEQTQYMRDPDGLTAHAVITVHAWTEPTATGDYSNAITPAALPITGKAITPVFSAATHYADTIAWSALPVVGRTITPVYSAAGTTTTVTAPNGMSWTFPGVVTHGTYVNGDPWVYTTTTLPMPTLSSPPTGSGATARNGGMINPTFNTLVEGAPYGQTATTPMRQGYDGRAIDAGASDILVYDAAYNAHVSASTLSPGQSLVSAVSISDADYALFLSNHRSISFMACLTVVNSIPASDAFRPNYSGTTKTSWKWSDLNLSLLPNRTAAFNPKGTTSNDFHIDAGSIRAAPGVEDPYITNEQAMRCNGLYDLQYWLTPIIGNNAISLLKPYRQQYGYPRDTGTAQSRLAAYVLHNFADRDVFLVNLIQVAIDTFAIANGFSGRAPFSGGAGFWAGPLWLIRFAGLLLNSTAMKNVASMTTPYNDYDGNPWPKWGEQGRVYYSSTAHAQYRMPGYITGSKPMFGDRPTSDLSGGMGPNNTYKDPNGVYDGFPYRQGFSLLYGTSSANSANGTTITLDTNASAVNNTYNGCPIVATLDGDRTQRSVITAYNGTTRVATVSPAFSIAPDTNDTYIIYSSTFPNILDDTYVDLQDIPVLGTYAIMNNCQMGSFMASIAMGDEGYEGGAVAAYNRRWANDRQMWLNWGVYFDYNSSGTGGLNFEYQRDIQGFGGTGNYWMSALWNALNPPAATITAGSLPITGQTITPTYTPGATATTIFAATLTADEAGWTGYSVRNGMMITGGAGATNQIRVTFEASSAGALAINNASVGISSQSTFVPGTEDCTATPVELTFNGGGHGFSITAGQTKTSDWVTLGGFTASNILLVTIDFGGANANVRKTSSLLGSASVVYTAAAADYADQNITSGGQSSGQVLSVNKIEVK
jgi:hypothetical protein